MQTEAACFALFDELPDVVFFCKDAQGRYTHANRTLLSRLGLRTLAALRGKTAAQVFPAQLGHNYLTQDLHVLRTGRSVASELELHLFPNHRPGWCLTVKHPIHHGSVVSGILGISRDLRSPSPQNPVFQRLSRTLALGRERCTEPMSVRALAQHAGLSVAQLERHWLALLQLTPGRWLLSLRLDAAIEALAGTDSVAQVAAHCGFADHSAFARAFRRHVGVSPSHYRQMRAASQASGLTTSA